MKVLLVHNEYQKQGGEDQVFRMEMELLRQNDIDVTTHVVSNSEIRGFISKSKAFLNTPYNHEMTKQAEILVRSVRPDLVHIHNFFPLLSPAFHVGAKRAGAAVVQTLHNFRLLCSNGLFLRNGKVCEKCQFQTNLWAVVHRCYKDSTLGSLAVKQMQDVLKSPQWIDSVDRFIALTEFSRQKFLNGGLPADKLVVKPNFVALGDWDRNEPRRGMLFVGRVSKEKGVDLVIKAALRFPSEHFTIIGDGPLKDQLQTLAPANVSFTGQLSNELTLKAMRKAKVLLFPSICFETFGLTIIEAYSNGLPVVASALGATSEIVIDGQTGFTFKSNDVEDLCRALDVVLRHPDFSNIQNNAYELFKRKFTSDINLEMLMSIYNQALVHSEKRHS
ncbi:MAG: hypothetical protein RLZZ157_479 [Pseudomonadota bacterium]|jgi:glycosyltransferase involved in cell wall biosynthesis